MSDRQIAKRNMDCALFLKHESARGLARRLETYATLAPGLMLLPKWRVAFAGILNAGPSTGGAIASPVCSGGAVTLYALRVREGKRTLVPVLEPREGIWARTKQAEASGVSHGEPLFRFVSGSEARDPETYLQEMLRDVSADIRDEVLRVFHCE
jgi:hypothetical protein